jgi:hypothetical protein
MCDSTIRDQEMACLGLFVPGLLQLHQYKNPNNISKILVRTSPSSSPKLFASIAEKYKTNTINHIAPIKTTSNEHQSKTNHSTKGYHVKDL